MYYYLTQSRPAETVYLFSLYVNNYIPDNRVLTLSFLAKWANRLPFLRRPIKYLLETAPGVLKILKKLVLQKS
jgi:hypothetical protein